MKATFLCSTFAVAVTGCLGFLLPTNKTNHQVQVVNEGGQLVAYKVVGNVGDDQATNAGIRVRSPSIDELRTWERVVELVAYSEAKACFRWTDYQSKGDSYGDGQITPPARYADYNATTMMLDTSSGKHYEAASPAVDSTPVSFQYDSYVTEEYAPPRWMPAVAHFERVIVETCFDTDAPLADETNARWTIKGNRWELSFDFAFGGGGTRTAKPSGPDDVRERADGRGPAPKPAEPAPPKRPDSFVGRWSGEVSMTLVEGKKSDGGRAHLTLAIVDAGAGSVALAFEGGSLDCSFRAKVNDRRATVAGGQVCKLERGQDSMTLKTIATELALSETGLTLSVQLSSTKKMSGKTEKGMITLTGELVSI